MKASIGHIKDLPSKGLGVDVLNNFEPNYEIIPDSKKRNNKKIVADLKKAAKEADAIYLAADPDREGEAICQHLAEEIVPKKPAKPTFRVMFNEITKRAVQRSVRASETDRREPRRRATGAARARSSGRLQSFAAAVSHDWRTSERRPRAVGGAAHGG